MELPPVVVSLDALLKFDIYITLNLIALEVVYG